MRFFTLILMVLVFINGFMHAMIDPKQLEVRDYLYADQRSTGFIKSVIDRDGKALGCDWQYMEPYLTYEGYKTLVVYKSKVGGCEPQPIAFLNYSFNDPHNIAEYTNMHALIHVMGVKQAYRQCGYARWLMTYLLSKWAQCDIKCNVVLFIKQQNEAAKKLFAQFGFTCIREDKKNQRLLMSVQSAADAIDAMRPKD